MKVRDEDLRMALDEAARPRRRSVRGCPAPNSLQRLLAGETRGAERSAIADHLVDCPDCAAECRAGLALEGFATDAADRIHRSGAAASQPVARISRRPVWLSAFAAAAAIILILTLPIARRWIGPREAEPLRGSSTEPLRSLVPEAMSQPRDRVILRWSPLAPSARYSVRVTTEDLTPVAFASDLVSNEYAVPKEALATVPPNSRLFWQVSASLPDNRSIASATFVVHVR